MLTLVIISIFYFFYSFLYRLISFFMIIGHNLGQIIFSSACTRGPQMNEKSQKSRYDEMNPLVVLHHLIVISYNQNNHIRIIAIHPSQYYFIYSPSLTQSSKILYLFHSSFFSQPKPIQ